MGQSTSVVLNSDFWIGPYGMRVPNNVDSVVAADGGNRRYKDGSETEAYFPNSPSKKEYLKKHAELRTDGHYWYKP